MSDSDLQRQLDQASREVERLRVENERLRELLGLSKRLPDIFRAAEVNGHSEASTADAPVSSSSSSAEKIALIRSLFCGRPDVYALRWENARTGQNGYVPAVVGGWNASRGGPKTYLPFSDEVVEDHLRGRESLGVYPLLTNDTCWFLAVDLDGRTWQLDAAALMDASSDRGVPAALELSRSGDGAHVWIFFAHRPTHARRRRQDDRARIRLLRHPRARAARDAHTTPPHLQVPRIQPRRIAHLIAAHRSNAGSMTITVELPEGILARLRAEADRRGVSIDLVIAELSRSLPTETPPARTTYSFIGLGSSSSGRGARETDELLSEGFGRD